MIIYCNSALYPYKDDVALSNMKEKYTLVQKSKPPQIGSHRYWVPPKISSAYDMKFDIEAPI